jgi:drug/metabolite transporter (DMT)-like permease
MVIHLLALLGVLGISFSAVFVRLANVSPVTAVFYRAIYAVPVLTALWLKSRAGDTRLNPARLLAALSGFVLALDLALWHRSIALIGAGLGTVVANVQVVIIAIIGWVFYHERPTIRTLVVIAGVLIGIALTSGLGGRDAYGSAPALGVLLGVAAGCCYAGFLLTFRQANRALVPRAGPLLDATIGMAVGALVVSPIDGGFAFAPWWPAHGWLVLMALVSQVVGWLLIAIALPRLAALETSILLLVQPVFALIWAKLFFAEHLSHLQWLGAALVLGGVAAMPIGNVTRRAS